MEERRPSSDHLDLIADLYRPGAGEASDPLLSALEIWDHDEYRPLKLTDPELYRLICMQLGFEAEILLVTGRSSWAGGAILSTSPGTATMRTWSTWCFRARD